MVDEPDQTDGGFLGRWSRRKLKPEADVPTPAPSPAVTQPVEDDTRLRDPETGELIDEDLVSRLPKVSELQAGGDLSAFMQKGVPEALRREALRSMWLNDPLIRNYVSPALDYAYDYNTPGGAPGFGPLTESDIAQARDFLANVFSTPQKTADGLETEQKTGNRDNESQPFGGPSSVVRLIDVASHNERKDDQTAVFESLNDEPLEVPILPQMDPDAMVQRNSDQPSTSVTSRPRRRRGGGAAPL